MDQQRAVGGSPEVGAKNLAGPVRVRIPIFD